jgi:7-hydroxymethyl chlorophyll a reductase
VHIKHADGSFEYVPYFCLPAGQLNDVIAPSCYSCFDYPNACADLVVGYMGVPYQNTDMTSHLQVSYLRIGPLGPGVRGDGATPRRVGGGG